MAEGKNLKFSFVLDDQSFARVKRALGELTTEAQKLAKALQGANLGGGGGILSPGGVNSRGSAAQTQSRNAGRGQGGGGIGAAILGDVDAFQKLAKSGTQSLAAMKDAVGRSLREQGSYVEKLDKQIKLLTDRYAGLKTEAQKANSQSALMGLTAERERAGGVFQQLIEAHMGITNRPFGAGSQMAQQLRGIPAGTPVGMGGGGLWEAIKKDGLFTDLTGGRGVGGAAQGMLEGLLGPSVGAAIARSVGIAIAGAQKVGETSISADRMGLNLYAKQGAAHAPFLQRWKAGDASDLDAMTAMRNLDAETGAQAFRSVFGKDRDMMDKWEALKATVGGDLTLSQFTDVYKDSITAERMNEITQQMKQTDTYQRMALGREYLDMTRGERGTANRIFGRGFNFLRDPTGQIKQDSTGGTQLADSFSSWKNDLYKKGFSVEEAAQGAVASRMGVGDSSLMGTIMHANASGWGAYGNLAISAARAGNRDLSLQALGGGVNRAAGIQLGQAILGSGYDPRGNVDKSAVFGAFQGGYGALMGKGGPLADPASHFNAVNQFMAGLGAGNAVVSGQTSGFQTGMNILNAIGAMPGGSAYAQDFLSTGMTYEQMIAGSQGRLTEGARLRGISQDMIKNQLAGSSKAALSMWVDEGAMDPVSRAMRKYRESGMSPMEFLQQKGISLDEKKALGVAFGQVTGQGDEAGIGWALGQAGIGTSAASGKAPGIKIDEAEAKKREEEIKRWEEMQKQLKINFGEFMGADSALTKAGAETAQNTKLIADMLATQFTKGTAETPEKFLERVRRSHVAQAVAVEATVRPNDGSDTAPPGMRGE